MYVCMYVCMCVCMYLCMYVSIHICVYIYIYIHIYIYIYIYTYISKQIIRLDFPSFLEDLVPVLPPARHVPDREVMLRCNGLVDPGLRGKDGKDPCLLLLMTQQSSKPQKADIK